MRTAVQQRPEYAQAWYMLGVALKQKGDLDEAMDALRKSIAIDGATSGPYNTLALLLRQKGDSAGAKSAFAKAAEIKRAAEQKQANMLRLGPSHDLR